MDEAFFHIRQMLRFYALAGNNIHLLIESVFQLMSESVTANAADLLKPGINKFDICAGRRLDGAGLCLVFIYIRPSIDQIGVQDRRLREK
jgi:hypothetical protein